MSLGGNPKCFYVNKYYEVTDIVLGRGSFSTVYLARHLIFGNKVAFKVINRNDIKEEYVSRNLHREAKILQKLNHPNIVNFYEELSQKELYCLSMEYIRGVDLSQYLKKQEAFRVSEKVAKTLFYQMVSAVCHLHHNNILHRDLKQENILLEHGKVIKIVDFGLSNIYQPKIKLRTHCGSMVYAAPELFQSRSVYGAGVDLWSLGVILYAMVTGRMPFELSKSASGSSTSFTRKELFFKRISQGLTKENWENMRMLSLDCRNLLENLLQPDQFKRIHIKAAISHPWFQKDRDLHRRLPQHRYDLKQKFIPEIIDFMADNMCVSKERVRSHIRYYKFDKISAIFYILRDTLMKEVLYPPRDLECSFLFRFEKWRTGFTTEESMAEECSTSKNNLISNFANPSRYSWLDGVQQKLSSSMNQSLVRTREEKNEYPCAEKTPNYVIDKIRKRLGAVSSDSKPQEKGNKVSSKNEFTVVQKTMKEATKSKEFTPLSLSPDKSANYCHNVPNQKSQPFRSYKNSRPCKVIPAALPATTEKNGKGLTEHTDNDSSEILGDNSTSNDKLGQRNKITANQCKISSCTENKNAAVKKSIGTYTTENGYQPKEACISHRRSFATRPSTSNIQSDNSSTRQIRSVSDKTHVSNNYLPEVPRQSETYFLRNILISRADRGCGRTFSNSGIPTRSFQNSTPSSSRQRFQIGNTFAQKPIIYGGTAFTSTAKKI